MATFAASSITNFKNKEKDMRLSNLLKKTMCLAALFLLAAVTLNAQNPKPFVIPELKEWTGQEGQFTPTSGMRIVYDDETLLPVAQNFAEDYALMFGTKPEVVTGKAKSGDIRLTLKKDKKLGKEGYSIQIGKQVVVSAPEAVGVYWATRTLLQISEQSETRALPQGKITDWPDYAVRGFMMDCGRKFIPMAYLKDFAKAMSYYKMNAFQIHLNDNGFKQYFENDWDKTYSAFRLECDTYPGLTARDGHYTKDEFRNFQLEAAEDFVEVIPEVDAPAHVLAFSHYKPELGSKEYGMDHFDLSNPEVYTFMDGLFKEYLEGENPVFVGPRVNIGTDEYSNKDQEVVEQFRAFTDHYIKYVESFGKQVCMWGALTHAKGETPVKSENVIMNAWYNGYADPKEMVKLGYKLISMPDGLLYIVPAAGYYYDYLNTKHLYEKWTPAHVANVVFDEKDPAILGGMYAVWNDHVGNGISVKDIHHRSFPALQTLSAKMWDGVNVTVPYEEFVQKSQMLSEAPGVNQMAKWGEPNSLILEQAAVKPGDQLAYPEVGYDYTVEFDIVAADEKPGTELFRSENAVFYLSDPISQKLGFARDGYLYTFDYQFFPGEKAHVSIVGDNTSTVLKVNGKVEGQLNTRTIYHNKDHKGDIRVVPTLVFPLEKAGDFKGRLTNLKVYNYKK